MLASTEMSSNSSSDWNDRRRPARARLPALYELMSVPASANVPADGLTKPVTASITVVLPAPFGPIRPTTSPGLTSNDTSFTATTPPKRTVTF